MNSALLDALLDSPVLPELIQEAQRALGREQRLREKFFQDITPEHKWEFINGEAIRLWPGPARRVSASDQIFCLLSTFVSVHHLGQVLHEKAMTAFPRNDYEPDVMFFGPAKAALIEPDTLRFPIPDLAVEVVSPTTESRDRGVKFQDYALHGVAEYWIVDPVAETIEAHRLEGDAYPAVERQSSGTVGSDVVPGFEVPVRAFFDEKENLAALRSILGGE